MKKLLLNILVFCLVVMLSIACSKEEHKTIGEPITVSLSLSGDIYVEHESLTKASTNDLYGINVYYDKDKDGTINEEYGYGLFDDASKMTITLISGYKYRFVCTLVRDGKTKLYSSNIGKYEAPFGQIMENQFILGNGVMSGLDSGTARMSGKEEDENIPRLDRFYGETTNYEPIENGNIEISLKRCSFGAKFVIKGLEDGELNASCDYNSQSIWSIKTSSNVEENEDIYSFPNVRACWASQSEYSLSIPLTMTYYSNRGKLWDIKDNQSLTFKRNMLSIITINIDPDMSGAALSTSQESLSDDNNIDLGINGNGLVDNTVEPN